MAQPTMTERGSSLFGKLTLRSKRQLSTTSQSKSKSTSASASSSSSRSASSLPTTPEIETPTSFSGPADLGLGYSSINYVHASTSHAKRSSRAVLPHPIEFDRYAESTSKNSKTLGRSNKLKIVLDEHEPLFVPIIDASASKSAIQSTIRARSSSGSPPKYTATLQSSRPQSPFAIVSSSSQSSFSMRPPPQRIEPRRCYSANDSEQFKASPFSAPDPTLPSDDVYYAVGRGWKKGVYTSKEDAERQIRNFPGPLLQVFRDRPAAETFIANAGRFSLPTVAQDDDADDELLERTRIFNGLDPNSDLARRRSLKMSAERKEAQRRSRIHIATHSPRHDAASTAVQSPPLSLRSMFSDVAPVSPIEEINGSGSFPMPVPLQSMSLLTVKDLSSAMAFYTKVLGFSVVSQVKDIQAVMSSSAATLCLRTVHHAGPSPTGSSPSRTSIIRVNPPLHGRSALPTMSEEDLNGTLSLPPTPESLSLPCADPEPFDLPSTSLPLRNAAISTISAQTVLIEYNGALEAMHTLISAKLNQYRLERTKAAAQSQTEGMHRSPGDSARILSGVQQTPWDAQELHLCDLDGHRIIYTTPFARATLAASLT